MQITTIGLDIAKNVFQIHGIDAAEKVILRKQLRRGQVTAFFEALAPCLVGMEACATSHHWARELTKLGHEVRLMPAKDVKAYVKRNKNDAADAEAICEAVRRPTMRFVRIKSAEQQGQLMLHRARDLLMRQRTQVINALRAHLAEFGITAAQGREGIKELLAIVAQGEGSRNRAALAFEPLKDLVRRDFAHQYEKRCGPGLNGGGGLLHPFVVDADIRQISTERAGRCAKGSANQRHQKDQANQTAPKGASNRTGSGGIDQLI